MELSRVVKQGKRPAGKSGFARWLRWILICAALVGGIGVFLFLAATSGGSGNSNKNSETFTVTRGDLPISVTESGGIKALNSMDIKSEVEGRTTIISIVDEGTTITPEDVNNKILVELDSSEIKERLTQQEISFLRSEADYTEAKEALDIQEKQNASDIQAGRMKVRFSLIDFKKYLGEAIAEKVVEQAASDPDSNIDMAAPLNDPQLGGSASQKLKELTDEIVLAESRFEQASDTLMWTKKLFGKEYVAETELRKDELEMQSREIQLEKAEIALELFKLYEFPKETEKLLNDYNEARRELERIEASARSKLAQAQAKLESYQATYSLQKERLEKLQKQLNACVIRAPAPGQVVYASSLMDQWMRRNYPIEIGAEIRERQKIISIPDPTEMKIEIKIHETWVDKVQPGQQAKITVAAFPDKTFTGKVLKKAPLADPEEWLNPDHKVYRTDVSIDGTHGFLKTGMTAKVEVVIDELQDVLNVPIQTVVTQEGTKLCYVMTDGGTEKRQVETGAFNNDFVEIKSGLAEGEKVLLNPPRITESQPADKKDKES
jgi:HlyD family secretion protein